MVSSLVGDCRIESSMFGANENCGPKGGEDGRSRNCPPSPPSDTRQVNAPKVGVGAYGTAFGAGAYGRMTYRLFDRTPLGDIGLHVAAGSCNPVLVKTAAEGQFVFVGPVLKRTIGNIVVLRASLGLIAGLGISDGMKIPIMPNLEVAFRLGGHHELTLGGNAIIGWRNPF